MIKCPICDSTRYTHYKDNGKCKRCGFIQKSMNVLDNEHLQEEISIKKILG